MNYRYSCSISLVPHFYLSSIRTPSTPSKLNYYHSMDISTLIGSNLRISVTDGRVVDGILSAVDCFGNMLLSNVVETSVDKLNSSKFHSRELGLVSVPRQEMKTIKMLKRQLRNLNQLESHMDEMSISPRV